MSPGSHDDVATTTRSGSATTPLVFHPTLRMQSWSFIIGSSLFALGSAPGLGKWLGTMGANTSFFVGAWFFTVAGFIQLLLSSPRIGPRGGVRAVWLAAAAQSFGTVLFNVSTGAALHTRQLSAERISSGRPTPRARWADTGTFVGALCFLVASAIYVVGPRPVTGGDA